MNVRRMAAVLAASTTAVAMTAGPAAAQQSGLVNVDVTHNTVQVPIAIAADVCGLQVGVLAQGLAQGPVTCQSGSTATATRGGGGGGGGGPQSGLVNLAIVGNTIQLPVGIAADVCGVQAAVLATALGQGGATCTATATPVAGA